MFGYKNATAWNNREVHVIGLVVPRYFWTTVSVDVYFDGSRIIRTGGVFRLSGVQTAEFEYQGQSHLMELSWQSGKSTIQFELNIDGHSILKSSVFPQNWPMLFVPVLAIGLLISIGHFLITRSN